MIKNQEKQTHFLPRRLEVIVLDMKTMIDRRVPKVMDNLANELFGQ